MILRTAETFTAVFRIKCLYDGYICKMKIPITFKGGEEFFVIRDYCFLKSYLESIDYNYSRYDKDSQKWVVDSLNRVVPVN